MPSSLHEVLVELFRDWPTLAARLLGTVCPDDLPAYSEARVESADLTEVQPAEYRADLVVVLREGSRPVVAIVVEVQLNRDAAKRYAWPAYAALARQRHRCPSCVLVLAPDSSVAQWAAQPVELGPGHSFCPVVLGPEGIPAVRDAKLAAQEPGLALLSVLGHGRGDVSLACALANIAWEACVGHPHGQLYFDLIVAWLGEAAREAFLMDPAKYEYQSEFARSYVAQGRAEGAAKMVLRQLEKRFGTLPPQARSRVQSAPVEDLELWAERLLTAATLEDVFEA